MIKKIISSEFFKASFWIFLAAGIMNVGNYVYHLLMGRMLGPELYGVLYSTIALLYDISIFTVPFTFIIVKFVSSYKGKGDKKSIGSLYYYLRNRFFLYGLITTVILLLASPFIVSFLHLPNIFFPVLIALSFFIGLFSVLIKGMLQGLFNFFGLFIVNTVEILSKLIIAVLLVYFGFRALGAFSALVFSIFLGLLIAIYFIRKEKLTEDQGFVEGRKLLKYSIPVFFTTLGLTSLITTDVILVRNLFSGIESGYYSALSTLGKIIFFATFPVTMVLFPLISEKYAGGKDYNHLLSIGLLLTFTISSTLLILYYVLPKFMVLLLFGSKFLDIASLLALFGVFTAIYSFCALLANFYLSIHKTIISVFVFTASILQIILIIFFHSSILQVINMSIISAVFLLGSLIIYYPFAIKKQKR